LPLRPSSRATSTSLGSTPLPLGTSPPPDESKSIPHAALQAASPAVEGPIADPLLQRRESIGSAKPVSRPPSASGKVSSRPPSAAKSAPDPPAAIASAAPVPAADPPRSRPSSGASISAAVDATPYPAAAAMLTSDEAALLSEALGEPPSPTTIPANADAGDPSAAEQVSG
jgi:hypothetical protein